MSETGGLDGLVYTVVELSGIGQGGWDVLSGADGAPAVSRPYHTLEEAAEVAAEAQHQLAALLAPVTRWRLTPKGEGYVAGYQAGRQGR